VKILFDINVVLDVLLNRQPFVDDSVRLVGMDSGFDDFEDAVQYHAGIIHNIDGLVTRNPRDYRAASLPVYLPGELLAVVGVSED
jgi:hypothetical protein